MPSHRKMSLARTWMPPTQLALVKVSLEWPRLRRSNLKVRFVSCEFRDHVANKKASDVDGEFHFFTKFPPEVQNMIWKAFLARWEGLGPAAPRIVTLKQTSQCEYHWSNEQKFEGELRPIDNSRNDSATKATHALLWTCKASGDAARKYIKQRGGDFPKIEHFQDNLFLRGLELSPHRDIYFLHDELTQYINKIVYHCEDYSPPGADRVFGFRAVEPSSMKKMQTLMVTEKDLQDAVRGDAIDSDDEADIGEAHEHPAKLLYLFNSKHDVGWAEDCDRLIIYMGNDLSYYGWGDTLAFEDLDIIPANTRAYLRQQKPHPLIARFLKVYGRPGYLEVFFARRKGSDKLMATLAAKPKNKWVMRKPKNR